MNVTKIISIADVHFPVIKGLDDLKETLSTFINQCKEIVDKEGKDNVRIVIAGDVFHAKLTISPENMIEVNAFFSELDNICKTIVIAGNHDMLMNNSDRIDAITPIFEIGDFKNVIYLDKELGYKSGIYKDDNIVWCLYSSFDEFKSPFENIRKSKDYTYVGLIHGEITGSETAMKYVSENGLNPSIFEKCDFVIAGHIHKFQEIDYKKTKIVYCSSLRQRDFGETISKHGFVLWDLSDKNNYTYQFIETPNPDGGFFKFSINDIEDIENDKEELLNE